MRRVLTSEFDGLNDHLDFWEVFDCLLWLLWLLWLESWRPEDLETWRAGGLEIWRPGNLESWRLRELVGARRQGKILVPPVLKVRQAAADR